MKSINLYSLTRTQDPDDFSRLLQSLSGRPFFKPVSAHEAASLRALTDQLALCFAEDPASGTEPGSWIRYFDGFWFSYTIAHISKEFDLLKFSEQADFVVNIELKSEAVDEEKIRKQLEQNRYYLSNVARSIYSYTYVMETNTLYRLNDRRYLRQCSFSELADVLQRQDLQTCITESLDHYFRASDYLISPVSNPERLLQGKYFLTNQQWDFRRIILQQLEIARKESAAPVITITGSAGTGKTLLLFDLALELSKKKNVLFLHGGPLREGHCILNSRLKKVTILSADSISEGCSAEKLIAGLFPEDAGSGDYAYLLIDEANRFPSSFLSELLSCSKSRRMPCILTYDPYSLLGTLRSMKETEEVIESFRTLALEFSGNIRINRPVFSFMRTLFHLKDRSGAADYSCIDVLYAGNRREEALLTEYYLSLGYTLLRSRADLSDAGEIVSSEYEKVLMILDAGFYYDDALYLCCSDPGGDDPSEPSEEGKPSGPPEEGKPSGPSEEGKPSGRSASSENSLGFLYEGLSRTRERLCLLITQNEHLFSQVLAIRTGFPAEKP